MRTGSSRYIIGAALVGLGALLLLSNTTVVNLDWGWDFAKAWWPVLLIVWGLWDLVSGGFRFRIWPIVLLLLGIGFQLSALGLWEWDFSVVWPALIVIVGLSILLGRRAHRNRVQQSGLIIEGTTVSRTGSRDLWRAIFNSVEESCAGQEFRGGEVETNFGDVALDLRGSTLVGGSARLDVNLTFGRLHLRTPANWHINIDGVNTHFGELKDDRPKPSSTTVAGELTIVGTVNFGNLEISG
ncbi:MAG: DUF5668 domain-containing protein [Chloroflexi bacterium]|nr:DUF5668 domain-containing protein [Chloroflexota bacterium]